MFSWNILLPHSPPFCYDSMQCQPEAVKQFIMPKVSSCSSALFYAQPIKTCIGMLPVPLALYRSFIVSNEGRHIGSLKATCWFSLWHNHFIKAVVTFHCFLFVQSCHLRTYMSNGWLQMHALIIRWCLTSIL